MEYQHRKRLFIALTCIPAALRGWLLLEQVLLRNAVRNSPYLG